MAASGRALKVQVAIEAAERAGGGRTVTYLGREAPPLERLSSGSFLLDWALCGGLARGRIYQYAGKPSSGKSTMALNACTHAVRAGGNALWACVEDFDWTYARSIGVPVDDQFALTQSPDGDALCDVIVDATSSGQWDVIVLDSVGALSNSVYATDGQGDWRKGVGERERGGLGALLSEFTKRLCSGFNGLTAMKVRRGRILAAIASEEAARKPSDRAVAKLRESLPPVLREPVVIVINQVRQKGIDGGYGGTDNPGGWALKHHKAADVEFTSVGLLWPGGKVEEEQVGGRPSKPVEGILARETFVNITKHKVGVPYRSGRLRIGQMDRDGFSMGRPDREFEIMQLGLMYGVIRQGGAWYSIGELKAQGEAKFAHMLRSEPELRTAVEREILAKAGL